MSEEKISPCPFCGDMNTELMFDEDYGQNDTETEFKNGAWFVHAYPVNTGSHLLTTICCGLKKFVNKSIFLL